LLPATGRGRLFRGKLGNVINGVFAFGSPGHPFLELALEIATINIERRHFDHVYPTTGPPIFMTLAWLPKLGSFDALIEQAATTPFKDFVRRYCETIGDYTRVERAFEGIEIATTMEHARFICSPGVPLPYKSSDTHWVNFKGSIFN
jgi:hypothetical protein